MDSEGELPLDISEFKCVSVTRGAVVVVFGQTNRRYTYAWRGRTLGLSDPAIVGEAAPHAPEVLDCLARAVAYRAASELSDAPRLWPAWRNTALRGPASVIRDLLHMR